MPKFNIRAGQLRHRLKIDERAEEDNEYGDTEPQWAEKSEVWGRIETLKAGESVFSDKSQNRATSLVTVRYRRDLDPTMRFRNDHNIYNIVGIRNAEERDWKLEIECSVEPDVTNDMLAEDGTIIRAEDGSKILLEN